MARFPPKTIRMRFSVIFDGTVHFYALEVSLLLEYGVRNFFSFKEGAIVSFRFDGNTPEGITQGRSCSTIMGVNGANAAGKTHLLKALRFISWFGARSFAGKPDSKMPLEAYARSSEPSEFYIEFEGTDVTYRYEFELTDAKVHREALYRTKAKRTLLFERIENTIAVATKEFSGLRTLTFRSNVSVISTVNQHQLKLLQDVFRFLDNILTPNIGYAGLRDQPVADFDSADFNTSMKFLFDVPAVREFTEDFIRACDTGVEKISIYKSEGEKGEPIFYPWFVHTIDDKEYEISLYEESSGTKRLIRTLPDYFCALNLGAVLVIDEFDLHLHPDILPKLLDLFTDPVSNPKNAQLVFTSHNARIMDSLGRYRTYIVAKRDNESFAFRLDEVPGDLLRNDRLISPIYEEGKIGGVPRI